MNNSFYDFFELVLTSFLDLILNNIHKNLQLSKIVVEESLELFSYYRPSNYALNFPIMMLSIV